MKNKSVYVLAAIIALIAFGSSLIVSPKAEAAVGNFGCSSWIEGNRAKAYCRQYQFQSSVRPIDHFYAGGKCRYPWGYTFWIYSGNARPYQTATTDQCPFLSTMVSSAVAVNEKR